jgi:hypothetical protein
MIDSEMQYLRRCVFPAPELLRNHLYLAACQRGIIRVSEALSL